MPPLLAVVLLVVLHPHGARGADELLLEGKGTMSALQCAKVRRARTRTLCSPYTHLMPPVSRRRFFSSVHIVAVSLAPWTRLGERGRRH